MNHVIESGYIHYFSQIRKDDSMKDQLIKLLTNEESTFTEMATKIWETPELAYEERFASTYQMNHLKEHGFRIQNPINSVDTAFVAEFGNGSPIIGILGEYDALPDLSQRVASEKKEITPGGPGHACGHNLLGTAGVEAVIALKKLMQQQNMEGTIRYYGCPAEEVVTGKVIMAEAGIFDDLDCALTWHPGMLNFIVNMEMPSTASIEFNFHGITSHAGAAPQAGKSALDAVELMNVGANYMRARIPDTARLHYIVKDGGTAINIVPDKATVLYSVRSAHKNITRHLLKRLHDLAKGASIMTETTFTSNLKGFVYEYLPNDYLGEVLFNNLKYVNDLDFTGEEQQFAMELISTVEPRVVDNSRKMFNYSYDTSLPTIEIYDERLRSVTLGASTDVSDVSWITPTVQFMTTCAPLGVQWHTWQATAAFGSSIGMKGRHLAAKTIALTVFDLLTTPALIENAKKEFKQLTNNEQYVPTLPSDFIPSPN